MAFLDGLAVVITGGTGSLGRALARHLLSGASGRPRKLVIFSRDEAKQQAMRLELQQIRRKAGDPASRDGEPALEFRLGDVRDYRAVCAVVRHADALVNAAALKQVPTCEYFPSEAVQTNVTGAENLVRAIREHRYPVRTVVGVSSDKACLPVNVMGLTKALQERVFVSANVTVPGTRFVCVRYGNVLASRGSVVPLFRDQIRAGGPVTITRADMTRFLLPMQRAVETVIAALEQARPGETFVPHARSARIADVAAAMIGDRDIRTVPIGIRPGEKVHEMLVSAEEGARTFHRGGLLAIRPLLPELDGGGETGAPLGGDYSSKDALLDGRDVATLLRLHGLIDNDVLLPDEDLLQ